QPVCVATALYRRLRARSDSDVRHRAARLRRAGRALHSVSALRLARLRELAGPQHLPRPAAERPALRRALDAALPARKARGSRLWRGRAPRPQLSHQGDGGSRRALGLPGAARGRAFRQRPARRDRQMDVALDGPRLRGHVRPRAGRAGAHSGLSLLYLLAQRLRGPALGSALLRTNDRLLRAAPADDLRLPRHAAHGPAPAVPRGTVPRPVRARDDAADGVRAEAVLLALSDRRVSGLLYGRRRLVAAFPGKAAPCFRARAGLHLSGAVRTGASCQPGSLSHERVA